MSGDGARISREETGAKIEPKLQVEKSKIVTINTWKAEISDLF